jgi:hypothetical protein
MSLCAPQETGGRQMFAIGNWLSIEGNKNKRDSQEDELRKLDSDVLATLKSGKTSEMFL